MLNSIFNILYFLPFFVITALFVYMLGFVGWGFEIIYVAAVFPLGLILSAQLKEVRSSLGTIVVLTLFSFFVFSSARLNIPFMSDGPVFYWFVATPFLSMEFAAFWSEYATFFLTLLALTATYAGLSLYVILTRLGASNRSLGFVQSSFIVIGGMVLLALHFAPLLLYGTSHVEKMRGEYFSKIYEEVVVDRFVDRRQEPVFILTNVDESAPCAYVSSLVDSFIKYRLITENSVSKTRAHCFGTAKDLYGTNQEDLQLPISHNQTFAVFKPVENFKKGDIVVVSASLPRGSTLWIEVAGNEIYKIPSSRVFRNYKDILRSAGQPVDSLSDGQQQSEFTVTSNKKETYTVLYPINSDNLKNFLTVFIWITPDKPKEATLLEIAKFPTEQNL